MSLAGYEYDYGTSAGGLAALLLMPQRDLKENKLLVVLPCHLYMDDAYSHDQSEAVAFGGWYSTFDRWIELESAWKRALKEEGISAFHGTDIDNRFGEFEGWSKDRCNQFMARLTTIAAEFTEYAVGCGIVRADYERLMPDWFQTDLKHPLNYCVYGTMALLVRQEQLGNFKATTKPMRTMIERKPGFEGFIADIYYRYRDRIAPDLLGDLSWGGKSEVPLQAADLIAHEIGKFVANSRYRPHLPMRKSLEVLGTRRKLLITTPDEERIENFVGYAELATGRRGLMLGPRW
jgi:hypothetical protein